MKGFTLVELIIVLVVVGLLSVAVAPLFVGSGNDEARALREQAKAVLRNIQLQAMQDTTAACKAAVITATTLGRPEQSCGTGSYTLTTTATNGSDRLLNIGDATVSTAGGLPSVPTAIEFGPLGRPNVPGCQQAPSGSGECRITFSTDDGSASLCLNQEGFIDDC